ncbi:adhesion G protein-coupled receptor F4 [Oryzias melastigma]|uniref:adhesion G protein-coupled receptor F4 n=1 Tax=Oryzias melastigma TaxID=30732 RepID=UPI000CF7FF6E|nr:adhesion G protein-coupled receptor F4 [Oryzias melastigma]
MDLAFDKAYNDQSNQVYIDVSGAINKTCDANNPPCSLFTLNFSSGSTIASYTVSASSISDDTVQKIKSGVFSDLSTKYSMTFDSDVPINANAYVGRTVTIDCGPIPSELAFGEDLVTGWKLNDKIITSNSTHIITAKQLTVSTFTQAGTVKAECTLTAGKKTFRQRGDIVVSNGYPRITVSPIEKLLQCGNAATLTCSVQDPYKVNFKDFGTDPAKEITYQLPSPNNCGSSEIKITCHLESDPEIERVITLKYTTQEFDCKGDPKFGDGYVGFIAKAPCDPNKVGEITARCMENKIFGNIQDNCVLKAVQDLLDQSGGLNDGTLPEFLDKLKGVALTSSKEISGSSATISAIVNILGNVASTPLFFNKTLMENVLLTTDVLTGDEAKDSWQFINKNDTQNLSRSSLLLESLEKITKIVQGDSFSIATPLILFNKTVFTDSFSGDFDSSVVVDIKVPGKTPLTVITFSSLDNVLRPRYLNENDLSKTINGKIALIQTNVKVNNISLTFDVFNDTLGNPVCAFWNFALFDGLGGWDDEGCFFVSDENSTVRCSCNHLTSFSVLMSPFAPKDPALDFITYAGVTISMVSLIICLIIEAIVWREVMKNGTSLLRHVCIVNVALSLLIANIWFIIMAATVDSGGDMGPLCTAVTFFNHFFYLAMFFWMLDSALLLLFRTMSVFGSGLSDMALMGIGFALGYGAPLIIASITIASTAGPKKYIQGCWLNWDNSRALLAFVIPALAIVLINFIILIVVLCKIFRSRAQSAQAGDKHILFVIAKSVAVLTPMFGLTWGLGIGLLVDPKNLGIHYSFAFFNSLQGFFILVFGTLLDKKVRSDLVKTSKSIFTGTRSTSGASSSTGIFRNWRARRGAINGYHISSSGTNNSSSNT